MAAPEDAGGARTVTVDALGALGDGIVHEGDATVFVAGALPGERVHVRIEDAAGDARRATLVEVLTPSPDRSAPPCPHFGTCGGCAVQHMGAGVYGPWKRGLVADALARAGLTAEVADPVAIPTPNRRRARLFVHHGRAGIELGFHQAASHRIVGLTACAVLEPALFAVTGPLRELFAELLAPGADAEAEMQLVDGAIDLVVRLPGALGLDLRECLARFAHLAGIARLSWQALAKGRARPGPIEPVIERAPIAVRFGAATVALPPLAFLQASTGGEAALTRLVAGLVPEGVPVVDLFSGAGTFALALAASRPVAAFDSDADAVAALESAARASGMGERVSATRRDLAANPLRADELAAFGAAVFDPPRAGARRQAAELAASRVPWVVAVSCNPRSFARDAKLLVDGGYKMGVVTPVDQFTWTPHMELVAGFSR